MVYVMMNTAETAPAILELRIPEYRHSGIRIPLVTIDTGIGLADRHILDNPAYGKKLVKASVEKLFRTIYVPGTTDPDIFLPDQYHPYDAVLAAQNIALGKSRGTEVEQYINSHQGVIVLEMESVYQHYKNHSYFCKVFILDQVNYPIV
ncbi:MAG: hypothetical protein LUG99_15810 [Lachnospiraceae bacterium]|nr:hypothetical protein [Lachnospiraceae bacterium]